MGTGVGVLGLKRREQETTRTSLCLSLGWPMLASPSGLLSWFCPRLPGSPSVQHPTLPARRPHRSAADVTDSHVPLCPARPVARGVARNTLPPPPFPTPAVPGFSQTLGTHLCKEGKAGLEFQESAPPLWVQQAERRVRTPIKRRRSLEVGSYSPFWSVEPAGLVGGSPMGGVKPRAERPLSSLSGSCRASSLVGHGEVRGSFSTS